MTDDLTLAQPPAPGRTRELWLQHLAGWILFRDVRDYARSRLSSALDDEARTAALEAIDDAVYGLMMVLDGITGGLKNDDWSVDLHTSVRLRKGTAVIDQVDLFEGDGMCMGFRYWLEGDFGETPIVSLP